MKLFNLSELARLLGISTTSFNNKLRRLNYNKFKKVDIDNIEKALKRELTEFVKELRKSINEEVPKIEEKQECQHLETFIRHDLDKIACVDCRKILE